MSHLSHLSLPPLGILVQSILRHEVGSNDDFYSCPPRSWKEDNPLNANDPKLDCLTARSLVALDYPQPFLGAWITWCIRWLRGHNVASDS